VRALIYAGGRLILVLQRTPGPAPRPLDPYLNLALKVAPHDARLATQDAWRTVLHVNMTRPAPAPNHLMTDGSFPADDISRYMAHAAQEAATRQPSLSLLLSLGGALDVG
jgi:hypothetical protein